MSVLSCGREQLSKLLERRYGSGLTSEVSVIRSGWPRDRSGPHGKTDEKEGSRRRKMWHRQMQVCGRQSWTMRVMALCRVDQQVQVSGGGDSQRMKGSCWEAPKFVRKAVCQQVKVWEGFALYRSNHQPAEKCPRKPARLALNGLEERSWWSYRHSPVSIIGLLSRLGCQWTTW
jgi:hypothetical protein